jgi:hypothetical protein
MKTSKEVMIKVHVIHYLKMFKNVNIWKQHQKI